MPPRQSPPPPGSARRRPAPVIPGGWIWLLLLLAVFGAILLFRETSTQEINPTDFLKLVDEKKISKVTFVGTDHIVGEVKDANDEFVKSLKLKDGKFST